MSKSTIFISNRTQTIRIPADMRFPETIKGVTVRAVGHDRILSPLENTWDSFFKDKATVSDDFMTERGEQSHTAREAF